MTEAASAHKSPRLRVLHVSPAHPFTDPRIVYKQTVSLSERYEVWCALPGANPSQTGRVRFLRLPFFRALWKRLVFCHPVILLRIIRVRPDILHLYMPELLPIGFLCHWFGIRVVYEVQENLYQKMNTKKTNNNWLFQKLFAWFDQRARRHFYLVFTEDSYLPEYDTLSKPYALVHNFPDTDALAAFRKPYLSASEGPPEFLYVGLISLERALDTLVQAVALLKPLFPAIRIHMFGRCTVPEAVLRQLPGFGQVQENLVFYGQSDHAVAMPFAARCVAGLAVLKPVGDYPGSYPTKLFEYMALGLPVITSDFALYRDVVDSNACGFCIDPYDARILADRMQFLIEHPQQAESMGRNGWAAVQRLYNWKSEQDQLLTLYRKVEQNQ